MPRTSLLPQTALIVLGIIWGANFLFMKVAVEALSPLQVAWLRLVFGAAPVLALAFGTRAFRSSDLWNAHHFAAMALLANAGPFVLFVIGTQHLPSGAAGAISGVTPCLTALAAAVALPTERLTARKAAGLAFGLAGVALVSGGELFQDAAAPSATGVFAILGGSASYAAAIVYARRFMPALGVGPVALAAYQTAIACVLLGVATPTAGLEALVESPRLFAAVVVGLGLVGTGLAFALYYYVIATLGAVTASTVYYIPPAVALAAGAAVMGEAVGPAQILGAAGIMLGVYVAGERQTRPK